MKQGKLKLANSKIGGLTNKAFTLIELLAIIVILAIIAVITVPIILNVIENSRKGSATDSAYGFKDAIQNYYISGLLGNQTQELPSGYVLVGLLPNDFPVSGEEPTEDSWIQLENGYVVAYSLKFGDYTVTKYKDTNLVCEKGNVQENEETRAERLKLEAKAQAATEVQTYIDSLLADTTIQGYTKDTGKKVSEISTPSYPTGVDTNSWIYFKKETSSVTAPDYSIKITIDDYTFVVNSVDGIVSSPIYNGELLAQKKPASFADDSWADIKANLTANRNFYSIGARKIVEIDLNGDNEITDNEKFTVRLANTSNSVANGCKTVINNEEVATPGFSQSACGVVIEFEDIITTHVFNNGKGSSNKTNEGGWPATDTIDSLYTYVNTTLYNMLPQDLKDVIINTYIVSGHGNQNKAVNYISTDRLYLLSYAEIWGSNNDYDTVTIASDNVTGITRQLEYYGQSGSTRIKKFNGTATSWWLRSARSNGSTYFNCIQTDGSRYNNLASNSSGVAPAFRILN